MSPVFSWGLEAPRGHYNSAFPFICLSLKGPPWDWLIMSSNCLRTGCPTNPSPPAWYWWEKRHKRVALLIGPPLGPQSTHRKAARYSGSPIGGSRPPAQATLTLKPSPLPAPTWKTGGKRDQRRAGTQERDSRTPALRDWLTWPFHFQIEERSTREANQPAQDPTASWDTGRANGARREHVVTSSAAPLPGKKLPSSWRCKEM